MLRLMYIKFGCFQKLDFEKSMGKLSFYVFYDGLVIRTFDCKVRRVLGDFFLTKKAGLIGGIHMEKSDKNNVRFFRTHPEDERVQQSLRIFSVLKRNDSVTKKDIVSRTGLSDSVVEEYIEFYKKKGLVEVSDSENEKIIVLNKNGKKVLGVGFARGECFLTVSSMDGSLQRKERIELDVFDNGHLKRKDIKNILSKIEEETQFKDIKFHAAGIALQENVERIKSGDTKFFIKEMNRVFNCRFFSARETTAAGYGERDFGTQTKGTDILFMHLDAGAGVIVKDEIIFEADEGDADRAYLRPWNQFGIVETAQDLLEKGIGTSIVDMVHGNKDRVTLEIVLKAADGGDEVAKDLVKRSALALGMRAAYLVNMFTTKTVILGGGKQENSEEFIKHVRDGANKFLLTGLAGKIEIVFGSLENEASSLGVGGLCRRELFMEV